MLPFAVLGVQRIKVWVLFDQLALAGQACAQGILVDKGDIRFVSKQMGVNFEGRFRKWKANVVFLPNDLAVGPSSVWVSTQWCAVARVDERLSHVAALVRLPCDAYQTMIRAPNKSETIDPIPRKIPKGSIICIFRPRRYITAIPAIDPVSAPIRIVGRRATAAAAGSSLRPRSQRPTVGFMSFCCTSRLVRRQWDVRPAPEAVDPVREQIHPDGGVYRDLDPGFGAVLYRREWHGDATGLSGA